MKKHLEFMRSFRNTIKEWRFVLRSDNRAICREFQRILADKGTDIAMQVIRQRETLVFNFGGDCQ